MRETESVEENVNDVKERVLEILKTLALRDSYEKEDHLQHHIKDELEKAGFKVKTSTKDKKKPATGTERAPEGIYIVGTSKWPDIEVTFGQESPVGIEVKIIRPKKDEQKAEESAAESIATCLGQALIYTVRYKRVIAFILHDGKYLPGHWKHDPDLERRLKANEIYVCLRSSKRTLSFPATEATKAVPATVNG